MNQRSYEAAQQALGIDLLTIDEPVQALDGIAPKELRELYPIQSELYTSALVAVAGVMRANAANRPGEDRTPDPEQYKELQARFSDERERLKLVNGILHFIRQEELSENPYLRNQQHGIFTALASFLQSPSIDPSHPLQKRGRIKSPTGSGKTAIESLMVEAARCGEEAPPKTILLVPKKEDVARMIGTRTPEHPEGFAKHTPNLSVTALSGKKRDLSGNVVVCTYSAFNHAIERGELKKEDFGLMICDEGHRAIGPTTQKNIRAFTENMPAVALTATPDYGIDHHVGELFEEQIYELGLREAVERGFLAPVNVMLYKTNVELQEPRGNDFTQEEFDRLIDNESRNAAAVDFAKDFVQQGKAGIIACAPGANTRHAMMIAERLTNEKVTDANGKERNIVAVAVHGGMSDKERDDIFSAYRNGSIDVITYVDLINEGWDMDRAKFLINLRPTSSPVLAEQRLGRILRGDELATVVDFVDTTKRSQYLALHALGEYRYTLGKVYGEMTEQVREGICIPGRLLVDMQDISGKRTSELVVEKDYIKRNYVNRTLDDLALELGVSPVLLALVAKRTGVLIEKDSTAKITTGGRAKKGDSYLYLINEADVDRLIIDIGSDAFAMLHSKDAGSLNEIAGVFFGTDNYKAQRGLNVAMTMYRKKMFLLETARNIDSKMNSVKKTAQTRVLNHSDVIELLDIANYVQPSNPKRQEFFKFLSDILGNVGIQSINEILTVLKNRNTLVISETTTSNNPHPNKNKKGVARVAVSFQATVHGKPMKVESFGKNKQIAREAALRQLILHTAQDSRIPVFGGNKPQDEPTTIDSPEANMPRVEVITSVLDNKESDEYAKLLITHFMGKKQIKSPVATKAVSKDAGIEESVVTWKVTLAHDDGSISESEFTGRGGSNSQATEHIRQRLTKHLIDVFGEPDNEALLKTLQKNARSALAAKQGLKQKPVDFKNTSSASMANLAAATYKVDDALISFMGQKNPNTYVAELAARGGKKSPNVRSQIKSGGVYEALVMLDLGNGVSLKVGVGYSLVQREAADKAYLNLVKALRTYKQGADKYGEEDIYKKLLNAGYLN